MPSAKVTHREAFKTPTVDEAFEALKKSDPQWLGTTLLRKWRGTTDAAIKTLNVPASTCLGPHDVTAPTFGLEHQPNAHLTRFKDFDWSLTDLGHISSWPDPLRRWVNVCMRDPRAVAMWWGPDRLCLYNQAYSGILGAKDAWALGKPLSESWTEKDASVAQLRHAFDKADASGEASFGANTCFFVERSGFLEEV